MILNIAIIDDDTAYAQNLNDLITEWANEYAVQTEISQADDPASFIDNFTETSKYNLIMADVQMPDVDGFTLAKRMHSINPKVLIIFVSNFIEFSLQGYEVNAIRYLHKSAYNFKDKLSESLLAVSAVLAARKPAVFTCKSGSEYVKVPYDEIQYFTADSHTLTLFTDDKSYTFRSSLNDISRELPVFFAPTSRSCIINIKKISAITPKGALMSSGAVIRISRNQRPKIVELFNTIFE